MKGVLALDVGNGKVEQLVYQGVHMNYSGELNGLIKQVRFTMFHCATQLHMLTV